MTFLGVRTLDVAGIPVDSSLRRPESIYYDSDIHELSDPSSSLPEQAAQVSEVPKVDQVLPAPVEASMDSHQDAGKGKEAETLQSKDKARRKGKTLPSLLRRPQTLLSLNPSKLLTQELLK